jgi:predicted ATPase/DNA-binding SARP family transcriptional activator
MDLEMETDMAELELFLLGNPRIERQGEPIEVDTRKAIALMAFLVMSGEVQSRDSLATLLWSEFDQSRARAALRRTLSPLRKGLGGESLDVTRESIGVREDLDYWLDVEQFRNLLDQTAAHGHGREEVCAECISPLEKAVELYRGDFMEGFTLRDSPNFDEWQFFQADRLSRELSGALDKLVQGLSATGAFRPAIAHAHRWLAMDPLREEVHRTLMSLHAWSGERSAALRQYRDCVRVLEQELGVSPLEETTRLYQTIKENQPLSPPSLAAVERGAPSSEEGPPGALQPRGQVASYPLVGRDQEWGALRTLYDQIGPEGRFAGVEGEAGIGKTRLGEEFLRSVRDRSGMVVSARSYEGESYLAFGPFVTALREAALTEGADERLASLPDRWLGEAARLVPELFDRFPHLKAPAPLDGPGAQSRFYEGVCQVLVAFGDGPHPGVLFLDDLHWADEASLELLAYLVRRLHMYPLMVMATWRSERIPPGHHLRKLIAEARREGTGVLISLSRLSQDDVHELAHTFPDVSFSPEEEQRLYHETEGLPFFVIEYLTALERGVRAEDEDGWVLPGGARDLLHSRLVGVSETAWQLLTTAAVLGRPFDDRTLIATSGRSTDETILGLEELLERGLIIESNPDRGKGEPAYDFSHAQLRKMVYEETSLARRRLLHRRAAETMMERRRASQDLLGVSAQIAQHFLDAGMEPEAADFYVRAGDHARALHANAEALAHYKAAIALGHPQPAMLHEAVGDLLVLRGAYADAISSYEVSAALVSPEGLARLERKLGNVYHRQGEWDLAVSHYQSAQTSLKGEGASDTAAHLYADWSLTAHRQGQTARALDLAQQALEQAESSGEGRNLAQAHNILGILARHQGELDTALDHLERSLALSHQLDDPSALVAGNNNLALAVASKGDLPAARTLFEKALTLCVAQGDRHREAALHNNLADLLHAAGEAEAAMEHLKKAVVLFAEIGQGEGDWQPEVWKLVEW